MATHDQLVGITIFFTVLNTITVALRIFARTKLSKGAFGWDDAMLIITYVSFARLQFQDYSHWLSTGLTHVIGWVYFVCIVHVRDYSLWLVSESHILLSLVCLIMDLSIRLGPW